MTTNVATTTMTRKEKLLTADDLLELDAKGVRGELIRGVLCKTMSTGTKHGKVVMKLGFLLGSVIYPQRLGSITASDSGVLLERDPDTVREPDIGYFSVEKMPIGDDSEGYADVIPDLVVEIVSPSDSWQSVHDKALMWLSYGVQLVWVGFPDERMVDVYPTGGAMFTLTEDDTLDGGDVLPGFSCRVSEIFDI